MTLRKREWIASLMLAIVFHFFVMLLSGCTTTKEVRQERKRERLEHKLQETINTSSQATTKTDTRNVIYTRITEEYIDTIKRSRSEISGSRPLNDILNGRPLVSETPDLILTTFYDSLTKTIRSQAVMKEQLIPVGAKRTTERHEVTDQKQEKKENSGSSVVRKDQLSTQSDTEIKNKDVTRTGFPVWLIILFVVAAVIGVAILLWRLKLF